MCISFIDPTWGNLVYKYKHILKDMWKLKLEYIHKYSDSTLVEIRKELEVTSGSGI